MPDMDVVTTLLSNPVLKNIFSRVISDGRVRIGELRELFPAVSKQDIQKAIKTLEDENLVAQAGDTKLSDFNVIYPTSVGLRVGRQLKIEGPSIVRGFKKLH